MSNVCTCHKSFPSRALSLGAGRFDPHPPARLTLLARKVDPTRTAGIRRRFIADMDKRFNELKRAIRKAVVEEDVFGLIPIASIRTLQLSTPGYRAYAFERDYDKVLHFMDWLRGEQDKGILKVTQSRDRLLGTVIEEPWTNMYIDSSYRQGVRRGVMELDRIRPEARQAIGFGEGGAFLAPVHAETVAFIYMRTFSNLRGITEAMDAQISEVLAEGIIQGSHPTVVARNINNRVDKIGRTRARTLARTETIRAHHLANIAEYERAGVQGVSIKAEWDAAGDACPECARMEARTQKTPMPIEEIKPLIPLHPNCRCVAIPVIYDPSTGRRL